jgi:hypothetical protein
MEKDGIDRIEGHEASGNEKNTEENDEEVEPWDLEDMYYKQWREEQAI